jgi:type IV fimbrial biogenesis protein FimT
MKHIGQKGFSLIEVLISLGILVILAAIAIPQMRGIIENYRLNGAARVVWSDMQNAKMTAIRENERIRVDFYPTSYNFVRIGTINEVIFTRNLANDYPGVTINSSRENITFNSRGTVNATTITISLAGKAKNFTIAWTGRIGEIL